MVPAGGWYRELSIDHQTFLSPLLEDSLPFIPYSSFLGFFSLPSQRAEFESQKSRDRIPDPPLPYPERASHITSLCLAPFSVNTDRNTCLPSRVFMKQQKCKYTVHRTGLIKQEGTASPFCSLPGTEHCSAPAQLVGIPEPSCPEAVTSTTGDWQAFLRGKDTAPALNELSCPADVFSVWMPCSWVTGQVVHQDLYQLVWSR